LRLTIGICGLGALILVFAMFKISPIAAMKKLPTPDSYPNPTRTAEITAP
jgi:hypothetical protein